ncbi:hypothetical protein EDE08_113218 [Bradyrhizobium sp. R2.2-H]|jgi:hypothetical protein|uniref:hypothetical protein n=1 Tax=unclassified Bradyrhizobium TaxID=2631580 RepID=UPI001046A474|nr:MULTISPECIES: hypothetical protein [unclassified Bradyrhizobium]TCU65604.1 hypothetical protein EDE10_113218 [Bradyrhizobium sp. Y-H1]TCU67751.1 hypothetical protein EDE08_113218 [Bradyrhizobium sp. R2.2-H]
MSNSTSTVNGEAMPSTIVMVREPFLVAKPRSSANALRSKIMIEAHARAKADYADELSCRGRAHHVNRPYSYYLGLQMRSGFAEARVARTDMAPAFELPAQRWA